MAETPEGFPHLIPLIWQQDGQNASPGYTNRNDLYDVPHLPYAVFNGDWADTQGAGPNVLSRYAGLYVGKVNVPSQMELNIGFTVVGNSVNISATVNLLEDITTTTNRILFILTHNFDDTQTPSYFASVVRYQEQIFNLNTAGQERTYNQTLQLSPAWNRDLINIIVIVQTFAGNREIHQAAMESLSNVSEKEETMIPLTRLNENFPNPFNPFTNISFVLEKNSNVRLDIFNIRGQLVRTLINSSFESGEHILSWNGLDEQNIPAGSGIYFYRLKADDFTDTKRMNLIK